MGISNVVMKPLMAAIGLIIALAGLPLMTSGVNDWQLLTYDVGTVNGARVERVVAPAAGATNANEAWYHSGLTAMPATGTLIAAGEYAQLQDDGSGGCELKTTATLDSGTVTEVYAQNGSELTLSAAGVVGGCKWTPASGIWSAGGFQDLIRLAFQAAALGLPVAVLFGVHIFGQQFLANLGVNPLMGTVILIVAFLIATRLLDSVTPFVQDASDAVGSVRYVVYQSGLGLLGAVVRNFYGIVLASGLLRLGWNAFGLMRGAASGQGMGMGMGGAGGGRM